MSRDDRVTIRLSVGELARLDELRGGASRAAFLRQLLRDVDPGAVRDAATRDEALAILTAMARDGKTHAAVALERALRARDGQPEPTPASLRDD